MMRKALKVNWEIKTWAETESCKNKISFFFLGNRKRVSQPLKKDVKSKECIFLNIPSERRRETSKNAACA